MSENGKLEDENIQAREDGGDDEVRAWSSYDSLRLRQRSHIRHFAAVMALTRTRR